jgi:hypothetical protein
LFSGRLLKAHPVFLFLGLADHIGEMIFRADVNTFIA